MAIVKMDSTKEELDLIIKIIKRADDENLLSTDRLCLMMDLEAVHTNDVKLQFGKLLNFPRFDFAHDIVGIQNCIDRKTGKLTKCFLPRCSGESIEEKKNEEE